VLAATALGLGAAHASADEWSTHLVSAPTGKGPDPSGGSTYSSVGGQMSPDGTRVAFDTSEQLVPADTNTTYDVYERVDGVTRLISAPPGGAAGGGRNEILAGDRIYFNTYASLVPDDTDGGLRDVYAESDGSLLLISTPGAGAVGPNQDAYLLAVSRDGSTAVFATTAHLTGDDDDACLCSDLFENTDGTTRLVSAPSSVSGANSLPPGFAAISVDGRRIFFQTRDSLTPDDADDQCPDQTKPYPTGCLDIYEWHDGTTRLVSAQESATPTPTNDDDGFNRVTPDIAGITPDGTHVFFDSGSLVPGEPAGLYERFGGHTRLVSAAEPGGSSDNANLIYFDGVTSDGGTVFFNTSQSLVPEDTDGGYYDVYERVGGTTKLLSVPGSGAADPGPAYAYFGGMSRDGSHVFFYSDGPYTTDDTNGTDPVPNQPSVSDVFERSNGETTLVSGPSAGNPDGGVYGGAFIGSSVDGSRVFFVGRNGIFERADGVTTFVSAPGPGGVPDTNVAPFWRGGMSEDGSRVMWVSYQRMTAADTDDRPDLYEAVLNDTGPPDAPPDSPGGTDPAGGSTGGVASDLAASPAVDVRQVAIPKKWRKLIKPGVRLLAGCDADCEVDVTVTVSRKLADAMGIPSTVVARGSGRSAAGGHQWVTATAPPNMREELKNFGGHGRMHVAVTARTPS
jgi:hypothetical protein